MSQNSQENDAGNRQLSPPTSLPGMYQRHSTQSGGYRAGEGDNDTASVSSYNTTNTFFPPMPGTSRDGSSMFQPPENFVPSGNTVAYSIGSFEQLDFQSPTKTRNKVKRTKTRNTGKTLSKVGSKHRAGKTSNVSRRSFIVLGTLFLLLALGSIAVVFGTDILEAEEAEFCDSFGISDEGARTVLADNFDASFDPQANSLEYSGISQLTCIPENAFALLSEEQSTNLAAAGVTSFLRFRDVPLQAINANAFPVELVGGIRQIFLENNQLESLPDNVFQNFTELNDVIISNNPFVRLDNNIMGTQANLDIVEMNDMPNLVAVPGFIAFQARLIILNLKNNPQLTQLNANAFQNVNDLFLDISGSGIITLNERSDLADLIGIPDNRITGAAEDFCDSFGISDQEARNLIASDISINVADTFIDDPGLTCLPKNAFSRLSAADATALANNVRSIIFAGARVGAINQAAFAENIFGNIESLILVDNLLTLLPDGVFEGFTSANFLALSGNLFTTLSNNIFGSTRNSLTFVAMNNMPNLVEFPEFLRFHPNMDEFECNGCNSLNNLNAAAFVGLNQLRTLELQGNSIPVTQGRVANDIRVALGLPGTTNIIL